MSAKTCRRGHDLTLPEALTKPTKGRKRGKCQVCHRATVRRYQQSAKGKATKRAWDEGRTRVHFPVDPMMWLEFVQNVGDRQAAPTLCAWIRAFNEGRRKRRLMVG